MRLAGKLPILSSMAIALTIWLPVHVARAESRDGAAEWASIVGWYQLADGREALLSWGADGGLRLATLDEPYFSQSFEPLPNESFLWKPSEEPPRSVRFEFNENGEVSGFHWTDEDRGSGQARRLSAQPYLLRELEYRNDAIVLSGTLLLPEADAPVSAAAMIHGSGDSDRDNIWYLVIADHLARNGVAVLLPDKRGCGKSGGDWTTSSMEDFALDTKASVEALRRLDAIDPGRIGLVGCSQGGRIAPLAVARGTDASYLVNLSGGVLPVNESLLHESRQTLRQKGLPGWLADSFAPFAAAVAKQRNPVWWEKNGTFDPMPYWRSLRPPALIVYGAEDEFDNVPVSRSVALLEQIPPAVDVTIQVYPDSGHGLFLPETRTVRPDFLALLASWIQQNSSGRPTQ
jgi:pimeloyl-ACP methyl ester carboxylesterase